MATLSTETYVRKSGKKITTYRVLIGGGNRPRQTIRLGEVSEKIAKEARSRIEALEKAALHASQLEPATTAWLDAIHDTIHEKLARVGLVEPRENRSTGAWTLEKLCQTFKDRASVKASTHAAYAQTLDSLKAWLGKDRDVATITPADADEWKKAISTATKGEGRQKKKRTTADGRLSHATVAKRVSVAKQVFGKAVLWKVLPHNPFAHLTAGSQVNEARQKYVSVEAIERILDAAPGVEWRALIGLCRYAGLRCPSEVGLLTWDDVDRATGKLTVRSPKTEHHAGGAVRFVPITPRLMSLLVEAYEAAPDGSKLVVPMASNKAVNLRTGFERIITKAQCEAWPRLFQALRASCETDWVQRFPAHVVAKWLGHSPRIAQAHYLITTEADFRAASGGNLPGTKDGTISTPQRPSGAFTRQGADSETLGKPENLALLYTCSMGDTGLEPVTPSLSS